MADRFWVGRQRTRPQVSTLTVGTANTGGTITVTVGGVRSVVVTPSTTNTTTTAAEVAAACAASTEGEFREITWTSALAVVTLTGPADGRPFTVAKADAGGNATTLATPTAALSPNDAGDAANYSPSGLPAAADRLVFQGDVPDVLWNLAALTNAITVYRAATHTGAIGLPTVNANGYPEYRARHLELNAVTVTLELNDADRAGQLRLRGTSASACTLTVTGPGTTAAPGEEAVEVYGITNSSAVRAVGASVAVCPAVGQTATVQSVTGVSSVFTLGPGLALDHATLYGCTARVFCAVDGTLTTDGGSSVEAAGAATAAGVTVEGGRVAWRSTATPGGVTVGSGGAFDLSAAPAAVAVSVVTLHAGGALVNPFDRITRPYTVTLQDCELREVGVAIGTGMNFTVN